ncbi:DUF6789 family protein [Microlunatus soli]|uniref:DUF6789 family protein n=1 Tax=Microlunatus soli TaxID=630515 RepID=UPI0012FAE7F9|nr:DUF6789 family protein [Microlunatus soli]
MLDTKRREFLSRGLRGARNGAEATGAMTAAFAAFDLLGWLGRLPPRQIIERLLPGSSEHTRRIATVISHTGYGAFFGAGYAFLPGRRSTTFGVIFGLAICAGNYEALLPALKIRPPLHADDRREIAAMVLAHIVYGVTLQRRISQRERSVDLHSDTDS